MKKIVFLLMIFSLFCFSGCGKKAEAISSDFIMMSVAINENMEIQQSVNFSVNSQKIKQKSKNNAEYLTFLANLVENVKKIRDEFLYTLALKYMANPDEKYKIGQGVILGSVAYFAESDSVGFSLTFTSPETWSYYYASAENSENEINNNNIFIKKTESRSQFLFCVKTDDGIMVGQKYKSIYLQSAFGLSFYETLSYYPDYVYSYMIPNKSIRSNADIKFSDTNLEYHVWKMSDKNLNNNKQVVVWYNKVNYGMWYLMALIIVLLPTMVLLLVHFCRGKRNNKEK